MATFLSTVAVLSALIAGGYSLNMYLFTQGSAGVRARALRRVRYLKSEPDVYDGGRWEKDYGLRYARTGILLIVGILLAMMLALAAALSAFLH